jgi:hypothetical protein
MWYKYTNLHFATGATGDGADLQWSIYVNQVSVVAYELLQMCNILRSRIGNSTPKLREFAVFFLFSWSLSDITCWAFQWFPFECRQTYTNYCLPAASKRFVCCRTYNIFLRAKLFNDFGLPLTVIWSVSERSNVSMRSKHSFCDSDKRNIDMAEIKYYFQEKQWYLLNINFI